MLGAAWCMTASFSRRHSRRHEKSSCKGVLAYAPALLSFTMGWCNKKATVSCWCLILHFPASRIMRQQISVHYKCFSLRNSLIECKADWDICLSSCHFLGKGCSEDPCLVISSLCHVKISQSDPEVTHQHFQPYLPSFSTCVIWLGSSSLAAPLAPPT